MRELKDYPSESAVPPTIPAHPDNVAQEIEAWRRRADEVFSSWDTMVARYASSTYDANGDYKDEHPINNAFEWIDTMRSQFIAGTPACNMRATTNDFGKSLKASAIKHSVNRLARDQNWKGGLRKLFVDWSLRRASWRLNMRPEPHLDRGPLDGPVMRPGWARVPPKCLIYDSRAFEWEETFMRGDQIAVSKRTLERMPALAPDEGWDLEAIKSCQAGAGMEKYLGKRQIQDGQRDDVLIYRIWFPDEQIDEDLGPAEGFFGVERVYAECERRASGGREYAGNLVEIRRPQPWFGPRGGPYGMAGQHYVPDNVEPLAMLVALEHVAKSMGLRAKTIEMAMARFKRILMESTGTRNLGHLIKTTAHEGVVKAKGFDGKNIQEFTIGGITPEMLAAYQFDSERWDRMSGLTATQRGQTRAGVTATAEAYAAGGSSARAAGMLDSFYEIPRDLFYGVSCMLDGNENFYMRLPPELYMETGVKIAAIRGGRQDGESFDDYEVIVEPLSMKYRSEEELRLIAEKELELMQVGAPLMVQTPWCDWEKVWRSLGDAYGIPDLPERFNYDLAEQVAGAMLMTQFQPGTAFQGSPASPQPFGGADQPREVAAEEQRPFGAPALASSMSSASQPATGSPSGRSTGARVGAATKKASKGA